MLGKIGTLAHRCKQSALITDQLRTNLQVRRVLPDSIPQGVNGHQCAWFYQLLLQRIDLQGAASLMNSE